MITETIKNAVIINIFVIAFFSAFLFAGKQKKKKFHSKNLNRLDSLSHDTEDEIIKRLRDESKYSKDFSKYGTKYVKQYTDFFAKMMGFLHIDLNEIQHIIDRADDKTYTAEEIAVKKVIGVLGLIVFSLLGIFVNYLMFIMAIAMYLSMSMIAEMELNKKYEEKKGKFRADLPSYIRLVANATFVGNSIEEALRKVSEKFPSVITDEIKKAEQFAQYSNDWLGALMFVSNKADIDEFEQLVSEIRITKEKGTSITSVLERLADKIEKENAYAMEALARKKASSLIIPTMIFLFLPMLLTILLPVGTMVLNML